MAFEALAERLKKNGFEVSVFETKEEAADYLDRVIDQQTVGAGGSMTLQEIGILPRLAKHNTVYSPELASAGGWKNIMETMHKAVTTDVYLMSANAIAADEGTILNMDGNGNRVSSSVYGHKKVYMVAGKNKISPDFDSAFWRLKNVVARKNAIRLHKNTPCAIKGDKCYDSECNYPDRICNVLMVQYKRTHYMPLEIVLIDEELGF